MCQDQPQLRIFNRHHHSRWMALHRRHGVGVIVELADIKYDARLDRRALRLEQRVDPIESFVSVRFGLSLQHRQFGHQCRIVPPGAIQQSARHRVPVGTGWDCSNIVVSFPERPASIGIQRLYGGLRVEGLKLRDAIGDLERMYGVRGICRRTAAEANG